MNIFKPCIFGFIFGSFEPGFEFLELFWACSARFQPQRTVGGGASSEPKQNVRNCKRQRGHPPTQHYTIAVAPGKGRTSLAGVALPADPWLACAIVVACSNDFCPGGETHGRKGSLWKVDPKKSKDKAAGLHFGSRNGAKTAPAACSIFSQAESGRGLEFSHSG